MTNTQITNLAKFNADISNVGSTSEPRKYFEKIGDELAESIEELVKSYVSNLNLGADIDCCVEDETAMWCELSDTIAHRLTVAYFLKIAV